MQAFRCYLNVNCFCYNKVHSLTACCNSVINNSNSLRTLSAFLDSWCNLSCSMKAPVAWKYSTYLWTYVSLTHVQYYGYVAWVIHVPWAIWSRIALLCKSLEYDLGMFTLVQRSYNSNFHPEVLSSNKTFACVLAWGSYMYKWISVLNTQFAQYNVYTGM